VIRYSQQPNNKPDYSATTPAQAAKAELDALRAGCDWSNLTRAEKEQMAALGKRLPGQRYARRAKRVKGPS
jgi:hypothetical protein